MNRPYASDWIMVGDGLLHSAERGMWWCIKTQTAYDKTSAEHNGIIGQGAQLKGLIKKHNK